MAESAALSVFVALLFFVDFASNKESLTDAIVIFRTSSIACRYVYRFDLKTAIRGRSAVPEIFARTRAWRRMRFILFLIFAFFMVQVTRLQLFCRLFYGLLRLNILFLIPYMVLAIAYF